MKGQVRSQLRRKRNHILQDVIAESARSYRERFVGRKMSALWESTSEMGEQGWLMEGLTENYLRVNAFAPSPRWNEMDDVSVMEIDGDRMRGVISNRG
jgi:threonylcarbamoyladenosine tRNA methylthiotransferase MtaB